MLRSRSRDAVVSHLAVNEPRRTAAPWVTGRRRERVAAPDMSEVLDGRIADSVGSRRRASGRGTPWRRAHFIARPHSHTGTRRSNSLQGSQHGPRHPKTIKPVAGATCLNPAHFASASRIPADATKRRVAGLPLPHFAARANSKSAPPDECKDRPTAFPGLAVASWRSPPSPLFPV